MAARTAFFISIILLSLARPAFPQEVPRLEARVSTQQATVGDEITLVLRVTVPPGFKLSAPSPRLSLAPFEAKGWKREESKALGAARVETFLATLTTFELGELAIPSIPFRIEDAEGNVGAVISQPIKVRIAPVGAHPEKNDDIKPIKGPVSVAAGLWPWFVLAGIVIACIFAFLLSRTRKPGGAHDPDSAKPAHERAEIELGRLNAQGHLLGGRVKEHYSEFADILRRYLERRYGVLALEKTSAEIIPDIRAKVPSQALNEIRELLEKADLVKFAKYKPETSMAAQFESRLRLILSLTKEEPAPEERSR